MHLPFLAAVALAGLGYVAGRQLVRRVPLLRRNFVPEPIAGGLLIAAVLLLLRLSGVTVEFPTSGASVDFLIALLTTNMGLHLSVRVLRRGVPLFAAFVGAAAALAALQFTLALAVTSALSADPVRAAIVAGPLSFVGAPFNLNPPSQTFTLEPLLGPAFERLKDTAQGVMMLGAVLGALLAGTLGRHLFRLAGEEPPKPSPSEQSPDVSLSEHAVNETHVLVLVLTVIAAAFGVQRVLLGAFPALRDDHVPVIVLSFLLGGLVRFLWSVLLRDRVKFPERALTVVLLGPTMSFVLTYAVMSLPLHQVRHVTPTLLLAAIPAVLASFVMARVLFSLLLRLTDRYYAAVIATAFAAVTTGWGPVGMAYLRRFISEEGPVEPMPAIMPLNAFYLFPWMMIGFTHLIVGWFT